MQGIGKKGAIGFDLAFENLHMLQFEKRGGCLYIRAAGTYPYPLRRDALLADPRRFADFVRCAMNDRPFHGRKVVSYLPSGQTRLINMHYEIAAGQVEEEVIIHGVLERLGGEYTDYIIDFMPIRREDPKTRERTTLVAVAKKSEVLAFLDLFNAAGLDVIALDIGPAALRRLLASLDWEEHYHGLLLINFGRVGSYITVLSGRRLVMDRAVPLGETHITGRLCKALDITEREALKLLIRCGMSGGERAEPAMDNADAISQVVCEILKPLFFTIAKEINKVLIYMASETRGKSVDRVHVLGSVARYPGIEKFLGEILSIPVQVLNPLAHFPRIPGDSVLGNLDPVASMSMAAGLALREV